ncbi:hypothetical protein Tco_0267869 [Tanacetum coccineum]
MAFCLLYYKPKHNVNQSIATSSEKTVATDSTVKKSRNITRKLYEKWSIHVMRILKLLSKLPVYIRDYEGNGSSFIRGLHAQVTNSSKLDKGTEFFNKISSCILAKEGKAETSLLETPEQTALCQKKEPMFYSKSVHCNSFDIEKNTYHIINAGWKTSVKFFTSLVSMLHHQKDGENLDKMKEKGDACIFVGYSTQSKAYRVFNKRTRMIVETIHVNFDELLLNMASGSRSVLDPGPHVQHRYDVYSELLNGNSPVVSTVFTVHMVQKQGGDIVCYVDYVKTCIISIKSSFRTTLEKDHPLAQYHWKSVWNSGKSRQLETDGDDVRYAQKKELISKSICTVARLEAVRLVHWYCCTHFIYSVPNGVKTAFLYDLKEEETALLMSLAEVDHSHLVQSSPAIRTKHIVVRKMGIVLEPIIKQALVEDLCFELGNPVKVDSLNNLITGIVFILLKREENPEDKTTVLQPHSSKVGFINHLLILKLSKSIIQRKISLILIFPSSTVLNVNYEFINWGDC